MVASAVEEPEYELSQRFIGSSGASVYEIGPDDMGTRDFDAIPKGKTGGRAAAVLALYESDLTNRPVAQCLDWIASELGLDAKLRRFASGLAQDAERQRRQLDLTLNRYSRRRTMDSASPVVRNVLRTAMVELELYPKTRTAVIVSEAVKLSQLLDTHVSGKFVNGVLGAFVRASGRDDS